MPDTTHPNDLPSSASPDDLDDVMTPEMTDDEAARARPVREAPLGLQAVLPKKKGGRPRVADPKAHVSLRIDPDVLAAFKATGPGWQTRMNDALAEAARKLNAA